MSRPRVIWFLGWPLYAIWVAAVLSLLLLALSCTTKVHTLKPSTTSFDWCMQARYGTHGQVQACFPSKYLCTEMNAMAHKRGGMVGVRGVTDCEVK